MNTKHVFSTSTLVLASKKDIQNALSVAESTKQQICLIHEFSLKVNDIRMYHNELIVTWKVI